VFTVQIHSEFNVREVLQLGELCVFKQFNYSQILGIEKLAQKNHRLGVRRSSKLYTLGVFVFGG